MSRDEGLQSSNPVFAERDRNYTATYNSLQFRLDPNLKFVRKNNIHKPTVAENGFVVLFKEKQKPGIPGLWGAKRPQEFDALDKLQSDFTCGVSPAASVCGRSAFFPLITCFTLLVHFEKSFQNLQKPENLNTLSQFRGQIILY